MLPNPVSCLLNHFVPFLIVLVLFLSVSHDVIRRHWLRLTPEDYTAAYIAIDTRQGNVKLIVMIEKYILFVCGTPGE